MKKILLLTFLLLPIFTYAQEEDFTNPNPNIFIDVELEEDSSPKVNIYDLTQESAMYVFSELAKLQESLKSGKIEKLKTSKEDKKATGKISSDLFTFINSVYLHCAIKKATCKEVLESILEIDIINSKINNKITCSNINRFWKSWIENDMEKRHSHQTKIAYISKTNEFNRVIRPRYTKCKTTISSILKNNKEKTSSEFFTERYSSLENSDVNKTIKLLEDIKENIPDIYDQVGLS